MKKLDIYKTANYLSVFLVLAMLALPLVAHGQFVPPDPAGTNLPRDASFSEILLRIIQILLGIAGLVAVIFLIVGGFRYITAGGNEETAEAAKKTITNSIIGIVVIILSFVIVRVISNALITSSV